MTDLEQSINRFLRFKELKPGDKRNYKIVIHLDRY